MTDTFAGLGLSLNSPIIGGAAVTPHDTNDLDVATRAIYVAVSGDVKVDLLNGDTVTFIDLAAGVLHWIRATRIYDTDTDATGIIGLY